MIKVEGEKLTFRGSDDEIFDELVSLLLAGAGDPRVRPIFSKALMEVDELLKGENTNECENS